MDYDKIIKHMGNVRPSKQDIWDAVDIDVTCRFDVGIDSPGAEGREYVESRGTITLKTNEGGVWGPSCTNSRHWVSHRLHYNIVKAFGSNLDLVDFLDELCRRGGALADEAEARYMEEKV